MSSPTVGEAIAVMMRHIRSLAPSLDVALDVRDECARLSLHETIPFGALRPFASEWWLCAFVSIVESLLGGPLPLRELRFAYAEPSHVVRYREQFPVPLRFAQPATALSLDAAVLDAKIAFADAVTARIAERSYLMTRAGSCAARRPARTGARPARHGPRPSAPPPGARSNAGPETCPPACAHSGLPPERARVHIAASNASSFCHDAASAEASYASGSWNCAPEAVASGLVKACLASG